VPAPFSVDIAVRKGVATVAFEGEIDLSVREAAAAALCDAVRSGAHRVVVDLGSVTYMDSTGLHCLLVARREAGERSVVFVVGAMSATVRRVLDIAGLTGSFAAV
jgi:anti-anti-sigma factor